MFDKKDFEKYMKDSEDYYDNREPMTERKLYQLWKDGAEFGYNKCFEQIKKLVNESTRLDCIIPELLRLQETENV